MGHRCWAKPGSPNYRPPRGLGHGGEASGWPARGAGNASSRAAAFDSERQPAAEHKSAGHMEAKEYREKLRERTAQAIAAYDDAFASGNPALALSAAKQLEDRLYGAAKQTIETQPDTRTDDEIRADIERRKKELGV